MAAKGWRAEDVAARLFISHRTVTRWLQGVTEPTPTLGRSLGALFETDWRKFYAEPVTDLMPADPDSKATVA